VFGAWTNLTDLKAGNTLDTLVTVNGRAVIRHYLQDVGSTFGTGANAPHDYVFSDKQRDAKLVSGQAAGKRKVWAMDTNDAESDFSPTRVALAI